MNCPRVSLEGEYGFSLTESLIAMAILSTIMMGSLEMLAISQKSLGSSHKSLEGAALAESRIETFRSIPYLTLLMPDFNGDGVVDVLMEDQGNGQFSGRQTLQGITLVSTIVADGADLPSSVASTIIVSAEWSDPQGQHRSVRFGLRRANPVYSGVPL